MDELERIFNRFDANGDGRISSSELSDVLQALGCVTSPEEIKRMMAEIDADGDGFIDLKEFVDFHQKGGNHDDNLLRELRDAFDMYDKDKNGQISANELHLVLNSLGEKCSVEDCSRMISFVDKDGDGSVSFEEFKLMMSNSQPCPQ